VAAAAEDPGALDPSVGGETFPLHPRLPRLWLLQGSILAAAGALAAGLWLLASGRWWLLPAVPVLAAALLWAGLRYRRAWARRYHCALLPDGLLLRHGVWWRTEVFVPRARVQHTEVHEGPLLRRLGMATLKVFTAGTRMAELEVQWLPRAAALELRDRLLDRHGRDAV
jgi:membrane protein YdbS with pleckstrin-like domain